MPKGLPRDIIKKYGVTKEAWRIYRSQRKRKAYKRVLSSVIPRERKMPRRRWYGRRRARARKSFTLPLAPVAGLIAGMATPINYALGGNYKGAMNTICENYIGFNPDVPGVWNPQTMWRGVAPLIAGFGIHWVASKMGINRALARAGVPVIRI